MLVQSVVLDAESMAHEVPLKTEAPASAAAVAEDDAVVPASVWPRSS